MYDIAVIGAGPAGASAAIFLAKAGKKTLMIENGLSVTRRALIKNHYGVTEITGPEMVQVGKSQAETMGADVVTAQVVNIVRNGDHFEVQTDGKVYPAAQVILATGLYTDLAERIGVETQPGTEPRIKTVVKVDSQGKTSIEGIWAAGTVAGVSMHTIVTAGDGAKVAINLLSELKGERYVDHDVYKPDK